jgi:hypothetical protein
MVGRGGRFGHCSRILPVWKWLLRRLSRRSMVERDFRLTGEGRASSTEFPSFRTQRACESHRIEPSQLMGALMEHCSHMWTCTLCGLLAGLGAQSDLDRLLPMSHSTYRVQSGRRCLAAALMRPRRRLQECGRKGGEHCLNHESGVKLTGRPQRQLAQGLRNSTSHRGCGHSQKFVFSSALLEWRNGTCHVTRGRRVWRAFPLDSSPRSEVLVRGRLSIPGVNGEMLGKSTLKRGEWQKPPRIPPRAPHECSLSSPKAPSTSAPCRRLWEHHYRPRGYEEVLANR